MEKRYILSGYLEHATELTIYDKLEDGTFSGRTPQCNGVIAFGVTLHEYENELRSTLEDRVVIGLKIQHYLPVTGALDLNKEPTREPIDALQA